jgi:predicted  nucleic acid-binding Zn-ribbon protein
MTLLGKIFTGFIAIMSVLFLGLAISVYATHVNWRLRVDNPDPNNPGLRQRLQRQESVNAQLREQQADLKAAISLEQMARRNALAALETKLRTRSDELERVNEQLTKATATAGTTSSALVTAQSELTAITQEVKKLRDDVQSAQKDADAKLVQAIKLTDEINQMRRVKDDLENRQRPLQDQVAALRDAMDRLGVRVDVNDDGTVRTDADRIPPNVKGFVIKVGEKNLIEISVGGDDGLLVGHTLDVYREGAYLGKVRVLTTSADRAVAEIIPDFKRGTIRKGDRVATKFS